MDEEGRWEVGRKGKEMPGRKPKESDIDQALTDVLHPCGTYGDGMWALNIPFPTRLAPSCVVFSFSQRLNYSEKLRTVHGLHRAHHLALCHLAGPAYPLVAPFDSQCTPNTRAASQGQPCREMSSWTLHSTEGTYRYGRASYLRL